MKSVTRSFFGPLFHVVRQREFLVPLEIGSIILAFVVLWAGSVAIFGASFEYHWPVWVTIVSAPFALSVPFVCVLLVAYLIGVSFTDINGR